MCLLYTTTDNFSKSLFAYVLDFWIGKTMFPKKTFFYSDLKNRSKILLQDLSVL